MNPVLIGIGVLCVLTGLGIFDKKKKVAEPAAAPAAPVVAAVPVATPTTPAAPV